MSKNDLFFTVDSLNCGGRQLIRRVGEEGLLKGELNKLAVLEKAMVGDTGFEPVTPTVWRKPRSKQKHRK
jgi:hypothetical protein